MTNTKDPLTAARDLLERYYAEKVWDWIPAVYKDEDALAARPDVLRSIVQILARQATIARRSVDRLWDDQFIELCDDWAIPYLGDLLGTRLVHELNRRGRRVDVARTIFYRRRKGTPLVLETLIHDITGWEGLVVESFRRLARTRHGLDSEPMGLEGLVTETPPGGWASLKSARVAELVDGPFDGFFHTPDFRRLRGKLGRDNISKLNFHLFRLPPFEVNFTTVAKFGEGRFTFDPSGRDIPLFRPDQRPRDQKHRRAREWELPAPISCRLLGEARYRVTAELVDQLVKKKEGDEGLPEAAADELSRYAGIVFRNEARLRETMASLNASAAILARFDALLAGAITEDSPKAHLIPSPIQSDPSAVSLALEDLVTGAPETIEQQRIVAGNLEDWGLSLGAPAPAKTLVIDPVLGRFWFPTPPGADQKVWAPVHHYGFSGRIGAGTYDRRGTILSRDLPVPTGGDDNPGPVVMHVPPSPFSGVFQFEDSKTYLPDGDVTGIDKVSFQAANFQRPYVKRITPAATEWIFAARPKAPAAPGALEPEGNRRYLTLDGLWIGIEREAAAPAPAPCRPVAAAVVLLGLFDRVVIRHCTLDPGGEKARIDPGQCQAIPYVRLLVRGNVEELIIESSIVGPIVEDKDSGEPGTVQRLIIRDSIVHSIDPAVPAVQTKLARVEMERVTVFGNVEVNRLVATEAFIQGRVEVTDNQHGCLRFSATNDDPRERLPQQFESHLFAPMTPSRFFVSRRFGDPGYAQLSDTAPEAVVRGAENGSQIGAFSTLLSPIKLDDLEAKVTELMPFGRVAQYINET